MKTLREVKIGETVKVVDVLGSDVPFSHLLTA